MSPVNAGRLRDRVIIQEAAEEIVTPAGTERLWVEARTVWARVTMITASGERRYQQAGYTNVTHEVLSRVVPVLLARHRFVWRDRVLEPVRPPFSPANARFQVTACREVTDEVSADASS